MTLLLFKPGRRYGGPPKLAPAARYLFATYYRAGDALRALDLEAPREGFYVTRPAIDLPPESRFHVGRYLASGYRVVATLQPGQAWQWL